MGKSVRGAEGVSKFCFFFFPLYYGLLILVTSFPKCPPGNFSSLSRPLTPVLYLPEVRLRAIASSDHLPLGPQLLLPQRDEAVLPHLRPALRQSPSLPLQGGVALGEGGGAWTATRQWCSQLGGAWSFNIYERQL